MSEKISMGEHKRGKYPLDVRLYRVTGVEEGEERVEKHVATVEIRSGEKVTIHAEDEALAKRIDDRLKKVVSTMTGGEIDGLFWDGWIELKPGDPGHAEAAMYEFDDLIPRYETEDARPD